MATPPAPVAADAPSAPDALSPDERLRLISERFDGYAARARGRSRGADGSGPALLRRLADDLDPARGRALAGVDLVTAYPAEALLPDPAPSRFLELVLFWARLLRDVLVFVPILVTWLRLQEALSAYGKAGSESSFLLGWQAGSFRPDHVERGIHDFDPLSVTARWVVIALAVVIVFAIVVNACENRLDRPRYEAERNQITQDLALASHLLGRTPDDQLSYRDVRTLVGRMESSVGGLIGRLASTADEIRATLDDGTGKRIERAVQAWIDKSAVLERALAEIRAPADTMEEFRKLQDDIAAGHRELRAELAELVTRVERATLATTDHAETVRHYQSSGQELLGDTVNRLVAGTDRLGVALERLEDLVADSRSFVAYARDVVEEGAR
jgi:methyl-accepting chemotaxis protein